jgi:hypothetical protein
MEIVPFTPSLATAWNALNRDARNGHFLFDRGFMDYHADRFSDASLMALDAGQPVALIPANRSGDAIHSHQGLTFGGLVVDTARATDVLAILDGCAAHWRADGARQLLYKPLPWIYHRRPAQEDLYWLFRRDARLVRRDLTASIRLALKGPLGSRRRRGARRAETAGVRTGPSDRFDAFWALLGEVLASRHGASPVHSLDEIVRLAGRFPENITLHAALAPDSDEMLAGVVMFRTANVSHAQYIAASEAGRALGALDQLFIHLIEAAEGPGYFDFGISNEDGGRVLNEGLIRQKEEFGASGVAHDLYEVSLD